MGYVAERRLKWGDAWISPGQPVPSHTGRNYELMLHAGEISGEADPSPPPRIVVPYTELHEDAGWALENHAPDCELKWVGGSDTAYFELLERLWEAGEDFVVIEQDVAIEAHTLKDFAQCPNSWCCAPYEYLGSPTYPGLGCVRFRSRLLHSAHDLMAAVAAYRFEGHSPRHWCVNDCAIQTELGKRGKTPCVHRPVRHCGDNRPTHGCCG